MVKMVPKAILTRERMPQLRAYKYNLFLMHHQGLISPGREQQACIARHDAPELPAVVLDAYLLIDGP